MDKSTNSTGKPSFSSRHAMLTRIAVIAGVLLIVVAMWGVSWVLIDYHITAPENRGAFGEKFGAVNALFAGLAFAGIIGTMWLQRDDLRLQRDELRLQRMELRLQREELQNTRKVFEEQNKMLSQQRFENTFFQMISLLNSIVDGFDIRDSRRNNEILTGRDCFGFFHNGLGDRVRLTMRKKDPEQRQRGASFRYDLHKATLEQILKAYGLLYKNNQSDLGHYFQTLYHIHKLIDDSDVEDKQRYASIVRAQLSSYELVILFYNCLHKNGNEKFKPLAEKYCLFKNIDDSLLFNPSDKMAYEESAFNKAT